MSIPEVITPRSLGDYLEIMTRAVFQAGVSWAQIEKSWDAYKAGFAQFDPETVAGFDELEVNRLMEQAGVMHSKKKIEATIKNARMLIEMDKKHNGFQNYLRSFDSYADLSKDMRKRFSFLGELSVYYLLFRVGEDVPEFEGWVETIEGDHPRMREMVEAHKKKS